MTLFLIIFLGIIVFLIIKSENRILFNELFWMFVFWGLIIGVYIFSGVIWKYRMSFSLGLYLVTILLVFLFGRKCGYNKKVKTFFRRGSNRKYQLYCWIGISGVILFSVDYIRLNGLFTAKSGYDISILGSIGNLMVPILLVLGLYIFADTLMNTGKISVSALLLLVIYSIPCVLNSGRESIVFIFVGVAAIWGYYARFHKKSYRYVSPKKLMRGILIIILAIGTIGFIVHISKERFGENEVSTFLNTHNVTSATIEEAETWGPFEFLYYNICSYFSHQISFLEFILKEYHGPYMFGMYELNIISRRLPTFLGLDYTLVSRQLRQMYAYTGVSYSGDWFTVLGSFIVDFGRIGSVIAIFACGYFVGKIKKKIRVCDDTRYAVLQAIICICMFSSIQLGPFYNTLIYGAFIWWFIIFGKDESYS